MPKSSGSQCSILLFKRGKDKGTGTFYTIIHSRSTTVSLVYPQPVGLQAPRVEQIAHLLLLNASAAPHHGTKEISENKPLQPYLCHPAPSLQSPSARGLRHRPRLQPLSKTQNTQKSVKTQSLPLTSAGPVPPARDTRDPPGTASPTEGRTTTAAGTGRYAPTNLQLSPEIVSMRRPAHVPHGNLLPSNINNWKRRSCAPST